MSSPTAKPPLPRNKTTITESTEKLSILTLRISNIRAGVQDAIDSLQGYEPSEPTATGTASGFTIDRDVTSLTSIISILITEVDKLEREICRVNVDAGFKGSEYTEITCTQILGNSTGLKIR